MTRFVVEVPEVHYQQVEVEAADEQEAINKVAEGDGNPIDGALEYSRRLDREYFRLDSTTGISRRPRMQTKEQNGYLALAALRLSEEPATSGVLHALTLIESVTPKPGTPEHSEAFAWAHSAMAGIA